MASAFGPLVEPGWPDLTKGAPDIGASFMKGIAGAATIAEIGAKRQRLENQLAMYALKMQDMEADNALARDRFDLAVKAQQLNSEQKQGALELAKERATNQADHWYNMHQEAIAREGRLSDTQKRKDEDKAKVEEASANLETVRARVQAENPNLEPGSDAFLAKLREAASADIGKLPTSSRNKWDAIFLHQHNEDRNFQVKSLDTDRKIFNSNVARVLQAGDTLNIDYDKFLHPETLPPYQTKEGGWFGTGVGAKTVDTGDKSIIVKDPVTQLPVARRVSMATLNQFKKDLQDLNRRQANVGSLISRHDIGVSGAHPWPSNGRAGLVPGQTYQKPDGSGEAGLWDGQKFLAP